MQDPDVEAAQDLIDSLVWWRRDFTWRAERDAAAVLPDGSARMLGDQLSACKELIKENDAIQSGLEIIIKNLAGDVPMEVAPLVEIITQVVLAIHRRYRATDIHEVSLGGGGSGKRRQGPTTRPYRVNRAPTPFAQEDLDAGRI